MPVDEVRANFNSHLRDLFIDTPKVLEEHERQIDAGEILPQFVSSQTESLERERGLMREEGDDVSAFQSAVIRLMKDWHETLRGLFLTISQSRKQRGGKDFEYQIQIMLELAEIPHEVQTRRERADFILPGIEMLRQNRPRAVLLSAKRTLRERWQEVVDELQRIGCPNTYLATTDENLTANVVAEIHQRNIYLVVWDEMKAAKFPASAAVVGYSQFVNELTNHFLPRW